MEPADIDINTLVDNDNDNSAAEFELADGADDHETLAPVTGAPFGLPTLLVRRSVLCAAAPRPHIHEGSKHHRAVVMLLVSVQPRNAAVCNTRVRGCPSVMSRGYCITLLDMFNSSQAAKSLQKPAPRFCQCRNSKLCSLPSADAAHCLLPQMLSQSSTTTLRRLR